MQRLTREQAAIIGCYTTVLCGPFSDFHEKAEALLDRPIWTHEFASQDLWRELKEKAKPEFMSLVNEEADEAL